MPSGLELRLFGCGEGDRGAGGLVAGPEVLLALVEDQDVAAQAVGVGEAEGAGRRGRFSFAATRTLNKREEPIFSICWSKISGSQKDGGGAGSGPSKGPGIAGALFAPLALSFFRGGPQG